MKRLSLVGLCWVAGWGLSSCISTGMVYSRNHPPLAVKGGLIRYSINESQSDNQKAREQAYREMHDYCAGPYRVTKEDDVYSLEEGIFLLKQNTFSSMLNNAFWYMDFECVSVQTSTAAVTTPSSTPNP